ncbi:MAG: 6-carboxytetrahydropterin synthase [Candidatus Dadabacteria bacterium]|nr:MAG: 6-carboxytetrahydropterin synthase [Candidatus Dadabacteria bacterium]
MSEREQYGITVEKEYLHFCAAHLLIYGPGNREALHGHNYQVRADVEGELSPESDLYINFLHIKPVIKEICDSLDHKTLIQAASPYIDVIEKEQSITLVLGPDDRISLPMRDVVMLDITNTTTELLARHIFELAIQKLSSQYPHALVETFTVWIEETPGQAAFYRKHFGTPTPLKTIVAAFDRK